MEPSDLGLERADVVSIDAASASSLASYQPEAPFSENSHTPIHDTFLHQPLQLDQSSMLVHPELTAHVPGETAAQHHTNNGAPVPQLTQFDPRALLNPKATNPKRPASSGADSDRGRTEPSNAGQVSLVERLHNVQERTASPAKRVKTDDLQRKPQPRPNFVGGSALDLQTQNSPVAQPSPQRPAIDLTMSKSNTQQHANMTNISRRRRRGSASHSRQRQ